MDIHVFSKAKKLVTTWQGREKDKIPVTVIEEVFEVHNLIFPENQQFDMWCHNCRVSTWKNLVNWYHENKNNFPL